MSTRALFDRLRQSGVSLFVCDNELRYRATPGAYSPELRAAVQRSRPIIAALLGATSEQLEAFEERAAIVQFDGGRSVDDAEWRAYAEVFVGNDAVAQSLGDPALATLLTVLGGKVTAVRSPNVVVRLEDHIQGQCGANDVTGEEAK